MKMWKWIQSQGLYLWCNLWFSASCHWQLPDSSLWAFAGHELACCVVLLDGRNSTPLSNRPPGKL